MRVAYLILAHHLPEQAARLARLIARSSPKASVFLHYDAKSGPFNYRLFAGAQRISLVPNPIKVEWGDWSQVQVLLHCLNYIREVTAFDWFTVLSGQDFPTQPIPHFEAYLAASRADVHIEAFPLEASSTTRTNRTVPRYSHTVSRYYYRHWKLPRFRYAHRVPKVIRDAWQSWLAKLPEGKGLFNYMWMPRGVPARFGIRRMRVPFGSGFNCWQGSDWFNLSRRAVEYLFDFLERRPEISRYYRHTCLPCESLYHTIYCNANDLQIELNNLRFIMWDSLDAASPRILTCANLGAMQSSSAFFARKFDMRTDPVVLDRLEHAVSPAQAN